MDQLAGALGTARKRDEAPRPTAYTIFDCETTGTMPGVDEIVSLAVICLDPDGIETRRFAHLVRPSRSIPAEATAVHGIGDAHVASAPSFADIALELLELLEGAVFVAHNARFDLGMLQPAFAQDRPIAVACTLDAFRLIDSLAPDHRLESLCKARGIRNANAHDASSDALATVALLRLLLEEGIAPETIELDHEAFMRLRSRGDTRPASSGQIRRVFALGYAALLDRDDILRLVARVTGTADVDALTREQVQNVYGALEHPIRRAA